MLFYQYLPIKLPHLTNPVYEERLKCFDELVGAICCDFIGRYGLDAYVESYVYMSAKQLYQSGNCPYNRPGWHCDGFMSDDINYVWSDKNPTEYNTSDFKLTMDDQLSMFEMEQQANPIHTFTYPNNTLVHLNQYNVHRVAATQEQGIRTFLKLSFSKDRYDLIGNSHNYLIDYDWEMKERKAERNIPQTLK